MFITEARKEGVGYVPRDVVKPPGGGVRPEDGGAARGAEGKGLGGGVVGDVGDIDEHSEAVHFVDECAADGASFVHPKFDLYQKARMDD